MIEKQTTFKQAYQTLQQHAETLRSQSEPDIDNLLTIVTEAVAAYKVCKARIDAVEQALEEALVGAALEPATPLAQTAPGDAQERRSLPSAWGDGGPELDDDIPF